MINIRMAMLCFVSLLCCGCSDFTGAQQASAGYPSAPELMIRYGCPTCHVIPGVPGAVGKVGPSLVSLSQRSYLAGILPNTPVNLEQWIMHPQRYHPGTAMPEMGVTVSDASRMATYLRVAKLEVFPGS
jgi:cytochrome c